MKKLTPSRLISGGALAAKGFRCAGVSCGLKTKAGALDLGLILSDTPAAAAAMFTTNRVCAAPVQLDREYLRGRAFRGIVVNAGNANACTGARGMRDARRMAELAAAQTGAPARSFLVASTGIIGRPMPMDKIEAGIRDAAGRLGRSPAHAKAIARAIMTTDTVPKAMAVECRIGGKAVRIGGIAKGSGMIAPNMATMLCFVTTDAAITRPMLRKALQMVVRATFNRITVDGDTSTNDTVAVLANGAAGNPLIEKMDENLGEFCFGLTRVAWELANRIICDGEGATRYVSVQVDGARTKREAERVARAIAESLLVKCAINGGDPNWGRIICAAGYSGAKVQPERMRLRVNGQLLFRDGVPTAVPVERLAACMKGKFIGIQLDLRLGNASVTMLTCDLSKKYVSINADYHT